MKDRQLSVHDKCPICGKHFDCTQWDLFDCSDYRGCEGCPGFLDSTYECSCIPESYILKLKELTALYSVTQEDNYVLSRENNVLRAQNKEIKDVNKYIRKRLLKNDKNR